jgi:hypothetical protein
VVVDSFNQNHNAGRPIQISFDFRSDLADMEAEDKARREAIEAVAS